MMQIVWHRIEHWLSVHAPELRGTLAPGASLDTIRRVERTLGLVLPADVVESYLVHDGQTSDQGGLFESWPLMPLDRCLMEWHALSDVWAPGEVEDLEVRPDPGIQPVWWSTKWLPLTDSGAGDTHALDLFPTSSGTFGQIIEVLHDDGRRRLLSPSFGSWLRTLADDLEKGLYFYSADYECLLRSENL
jgi:cell wall assembly regulator SMI1